MCRVVFVSHQDQSSVAMMMVDDDNVSARTNRPLCAETHHKQLLLMRERFNIINVYSFKNPVSFLGGKNAEALIIFDDKNGGSVPKVFVMTEISAV